MTVEVLYVGPLSNATDSDPAAAYTQSGPSSPTIVGPEPILSDGSTATYAEVTETRTVSSGSVTTITRRDYAKGKLDVLSVDSTRATLNSVRVVLVGDGLSWTTPSEPAEEVDLYDPTSWDTTWGWLTRWEAAGYTDPFNSGDITYAPGSWGSSFRHPSSGATFTGAEVLDFLASGNAYIRALVTGGGATAPGSYTSTGRVYEFRVEVDYTPTVITPPMMRQYPNPISRGRLWPRPRRGITGIR